MIYSLLFIVSLASGLLVFGFKDKLKPSITALLSFSGSYLLSVCFLHLLPELFHQATSEIGIYLLVGFFLQLILDYFSGGIEHGHTHVNHSKVGSFPLLIFLSLGMHAFLEAMPVHHLSHSSNISSYLIGLLLHKAPISFILATLLLGYELKKTSIILGIIVFSLISPLGVFVGSYLEVSTDLFQNLLAISIGIILHLSTTILLETNGDHKIKWKKLLPLFGGIAFALLSLVGE